MKKTIVATSLFLFSLVAAWAGDRSEHLAGVERTARGACLVDVIYSEELPGAPIFQNLVRARLRITPPDGPPFETTVERFMPWQVPPPRRGQRLRMACDPAVLNSFRLY